ncbi:hypothetical protein ACEPAF_3590 [Sanghuangporus sanghuang]
MKTRSSSRSTTVSSAETARPSTSSTRGTSTRRRANKDDCSPSKRSRPRITTKGAAAGMRSSAQINVGSSTSEVHAPPSSPSQPTLSADSGDHFGLGASDYYSLIEQWLEANEPPRDSLPEMQSPEDEEVYEEMLAKYTNHSDLMEWE